MHDTHQLTGGDERQPLLESEPATPSTAASYGGTTTTSESASEAPPTDAGGPGRLFLSLLVDSVPVILSYALQNSIQTSAILVVGRLGPDELSAAAFSLMFAMVTGWCVALGGTTALDTLGSQAFTGGERRTDVSIHLQRCIFLLWLLFAPVAVLWIYAYPVLLAFGQAERLSRDVQAFLRILIIGAPGYIAFESLKKYLQCQGIMRASTAVLIAVLPVNVLLNILLVHHTPLRFLGSPLALSLSYWLAFFLLVIVTRLSPAHQRNGTWGGLDLATVLDFSSCIEFLKLAIPGILMVGTEWAAFEIVALAAGRLGALPLAAQSIIMTADQILNTIPFGIGVAASTRVGNYIGSRSAALAKRASHMSAFLSVIVGGFVMASLLVTKNVFGYLFSDEPDVVRLVSKVMPLVASFQIADGLAGSCGGVLRGQGRQHLGALFNLIAYYVLALPMGITLAFNSRTHMGLQGLWIGQVVALFIVGFGEYAVVWLGTDWDKEIQKGIERNKEQAKIRALRHSAENPGNDC